jgi:aminoglycoside phosphotransferase (APT) family kinase protein
MHADEVQTDEGLVRQLLATQLPDWASLPLERVPSSGTDNALYRLGDDKVVRLPRIDWAVAGLERELEWLPRLAPLLPVAIPVPLAAGAPGDGYPWPWAVYRWLDGENPRSGRVEAHESLARELAELIRSFRRIDLAGPPTRRGVPLVQQDDAVRAALRALHGEIDVAAATSAWGVSLRAPDWAGPPIWLHGDLLPGNLLCRDGNLSGVLDFGLVGMGDPACDLIAAWAVLPFSAREIFREELYVDDATWARGRGWALSIALIALPYYKDTNPGFADVARHLIRETLAGL